MRLGMTAFTLGLIGIATSASAQIWIGQVVGNIADQERIARQRHECMMGESKMPEAEVTETIGQTSNIMRAYFAAASRSPANVAPFYHLSGKKRWMSGKLSIGSSGLAKVTDPLAIQEGAAIDQAPTAHVRSGDTSLVQSLWTVRNSAGTPIGYYDAFLTRNLGVWRLRSLTVVTGTAAPTSITPFCEKPGDVQPYRIAFAERERLRAEKQARKAAERAARANADAQR